MFIAKNQIKFKLIAVIVAIALIAPMVIMPVGTAQAGENVKETSIGVTVSGSLPQEVIDAINLNGAEIEIMENGTPVIVVEIEKKEDEEIYYIPLTLPSTAEVKNIADGSKTTVEVDGNYLLIPYGEEIERVCISDFEVKKVKDNGQVVLVGEVNFIRVILLIIAREVGREVIGYVINKVIDESRNRGTIESKDDPIVIWRNNEAVFYFDICPPPQMLDRFSVSVKAFDIDREWGERVNVYFISGGTTLWLGTLARGDNETTTWTLMRVPSHQLDTIYNALVRNDGKFQIKFEKVTSGGARIDWLRINWSW